MSLACTLATKLADAASMRAPICPWPSMGLCQKTLTKRLLKTASSDFHAANASSWFEKLTRAFEPLTSTATFVTVPNFLNQSLMAPRLSLSSGIFSTTSVLSPRRSGRKFAASALNVPRP